MEKKFKCKDEVIFRRKISFGNGTLYTWDYGVVTYEDKGIIHFVGGINVSYREYDILSYEGNEHLVGTTDEPEEEVELEKGEWIMVTDGCLVVPEDWKIRRYDSVDGLIRAFNNSSASLSTWKYAIRFRDFDPSNMEETKKHILCVKNGRIIRYKG